MESEETQDYVREANDMDQEEGDEVSFVPSAIRVPQTPLFRCDNRCGEKVSTYERCGKDYCREWLSSEEASRGRRERKASRSTGPVASGIASQGVFGASEVLQ